MLYEVMVHGLFDDGRRGVRRTQALLGWSCYQLKTRCVPVVVFWGLTGHSLLLIEDLKERCGHICRIA